MTHHREVVDTVLKRLGARDAGCSVLLSGSVQRGEAHVGSDIDLLFVVPALAGFQAPEGRVEYQTDHAKVIDGEVDGVPVTYNCFDYVVLAEMTREPWKNYPFAQAEVLVDVGGIVEACQKSISAWFAAHQHVAQMWQEQEAKHRACKLEERRGNAGSGLAFASWEAFADHVDRVINAEPGDPPGCLQRARRGQFEGDGKRSVKE